MKEVTLTEIQDRIKAFTWKKWLQRHFSPLVSSFFVEGSTPLSFEKIGITSMIRMSTVFQDCFWYESAEVWQNAVEEIKHYFQEHSIFDLTQSLKKFHRQKKKRINLLAKQAGHPLEQFKEVYQILTLGAAYIWSAHILEIYYTKILNQEVPKYVKNDIDKFIGDASFPKKKNVSALMDEAMRKGQDPKKIAEEYGWIKVRYSFDEPFSVQEIQDLIKELGPKEKYKRVKIPKELQSLFKEVQELVFFRTARTDVFYELMFLARPIFRKVADFYHLPFSELTTCTAQSLIAGQPKKFGLNYTFAQYGDEYYFGHEPIIKEEEVKKDDFVKGRVAFKGDAVGTVKIVKSVAELDKVEKGDILVTPMTFPSYIIAMHRAAAFVTDEGGITCHAAIVAREMQKPCIVGTGKATKIFHDGDMVEVHADQGIVKIIKRAK